MRTTLRGASNLYFAVIQSALSIPEWDDPVHAAISHYEEQLIKVDSVERLRNGIENGFLPALAAFDAEHIFRALQKRRTQASKHVTSLDLRREEYNALRNPSNTQRAAAREFEAEPAQVPNAFRTRISRVMIVRRLREVRALSGFTRIDTPADALLDDEAEQLRFRVQALSSSENHWRPAIELRGEGVFVELSEPAVRKWEAGVAVVERSASMRALHHDWRRAHDLPDAEYPGPRFVLLHSLAHMIIQGLALDCGYSASSIRERIYSSSDSEEPMSGILLYTATPDSDGSLGGLADKGAVKRLEPLLQEALERAAFCSSDPLCGHSAPGEIGRLNGAACHACLLVSETSCERGNQYLDRAHVVDTISQLGTNFF